MDAEGDLIWGDKEKSLVLEPVSSSLTVLLRHSWKPKFLASLPNRFFFSLLSFASHGIVNLMGRNA